MVLRRLARWQKRFQPLPIAALSLATAWFLFKGAEMTRESNALAREKALIERDTAALNLKTAQANASVNRTVPGPPMPASLPTDRRPAKRSHAGTKSRNRTN